MKNRVKKAIRYVNEYMKGKRYNPRLCLTEEEAKIVAREVPYPYILRKENMVNQESLYMWKIKHF